jgi:hypothetical protein
MSLKPKKSQIPPEQQSAKPDKLTGPWGRINPGAPSFDVVRFCQGTTTGTEKMHSYPYRVISSWHWTNGIPEEELKLEAAGDVVIVRGRSLDRIVDALDRGTLEILREIAGETPLPEEDSIWITAISIEGKQVELS